MSQKQTPKGPEDQPASVYLCSCGGEGILISAWDEVEGGREINISLWSAGSYKHKVFGVREKIRWCWRILTKGYPFVDEVLMTPTMARNLAKGLLNLTKE
jgi:hypothetical protein